MACVRAQGEKLESLKALEGSRMAGEVVRVFRRNTHPVEGNLKESHSSPVQENVCVWHCGSVSARQSEQARVRGCAGPPCRPLCVTQKESSHSILTSTDKAEGLLGL